MLLQRLKEYSERLSLPPKLFSQSPVRYIIELASDGSFLGMVDTADSSDRRTRRGQPRLAPQVQRSSGIRALLLADKADYALGYAGQRDKPERVPACHKAFLELATRCAEHTKEPAVAAVLAFLQNNPLDQVGIGDSFDPGALITFRVDGVFPIDLPSVQGFWADTNDPSLASAPIMQCVVCGQERPVLERLQAKLKGVPGGQPSGTSIISANAEAFESYGLQASLISPTCADCGERFTKAANELLSSQSNCIRMSGMAFVFWTKAAPDVDLWASFAAPRPEEVQALISSVRSGKHVPEIDDAPFYATALSGSGGRAVVRDWLDTTVGEVKQHLAHWFQRQQIVDTDGEEGRFYGVRALALATVREAKDLPSPVARSLLRSAMTGAPLPMDILYQAVRRNRAEQRVTRPRAALIKLGLMGQPDFNGKEDSMTILETDHPDVAYHCGRLLAVLEEAQRAAIPGINATLVDRFFGTASSAPASVLGRLLRGAQPHLSKLERDNRGAYYAIQNRMEEVLNHVPGRTAFPRILTLEQQGLFALGYYHQRSNDRMQAREAAQRRRQGLAVPPGSAVPPEALGEDEASQD